MFEIQSRKAVGGQSAIGRLCSHLKNTQTERFCDVVCSEVDVVALLIEHQTCNLQVTGPSSGWAPLHSGFGHLAAMHL